MLVYIVYIVDLLPSFLEIIKDYPIPAKMIQFDEHIFQMG